MKLGGPQNPLVATPLQQTKSLLMKLGPQAPRNRVPRPDLAEHLVEGDVGPLWAGAGDTTSAATAVAKSGGETRPLESLSTVPRQNPISQSSTLLNTTLGPYGPEQMAYSERRLAFVVQSKLDDQDYYHNSRKICWCSTASWDY